LKSFDSGNKTIVTVVSYTYSHVEQIER